MGRLGGLLGKTRRAALALYRSFYVRAAVVAVAVAAGPPVVLAPLLTNLHPGLTRDAFLVLYTDALWTAASVMGTYYGQGVFRHARKALRFSAQALGRKHARLVFALNQRKAAFLLLAVTGGVVIGSVVIPGDVRTLLSAEERLQIDASGLFNRYTLVFIISCVAMALRTLWQIYESWGETRAARDERQDARSDAQDARDERQDERSARQSRRGAAQDERGAEQDRRGENPSGGS